MMVRTLLGCDSEILLPRLRALLDEIPGLEILAEAFDASAVLRAAAETDPGLIVLCFSRPSGPARQLVSALRTMKPGVLIIALTTSMTHCQDDSWRHAGATYVFSLTLQLDQLTDCLTAITQTGEIREFLRPGDSAHDSQPKGKENL